MTKSTDIKNGDEKKSKSSQVLEDLIEWFEFIKELKDFHKTVKKVLGHKQRENLQIEMLFRDFQRAMDRILKIKKWVERYYLIQ